MKLKLCILTATLLCTPLYAGAVEETIKIYPHESDGYTRTNDNDGFTDWGMARDYDGEVFDQVPASDIDQIWARSDNGSGFYRFLRASLPFDTSVIPSDAIIHSANLNLFGIINNNNTDAVITSHIRTNEVSLTKTDWHILKYGTENEFARRSIVAGEYNVVPLNEKGIIHINTSGFTTFGLLTENDFDNDISGTSNVTSYAFSSVDAPGTTTDPYLEVFYEIPDTPIILSELLENLINEIQTAGIAASQRRSYMAHLQSIESFYESGKLIAAENQIRHFMSKLTNDFLKGKITLEQNESWYEQADAILEIILEFALNESEKFPLMTQIESPFPPESADWEDDVFGNGVASWCGNTIGGCGCAISSLAMLGAYHEINTGLDGEEVNPGSLNAWLTATNGYSPANNVIWNHALAYFSDMEGFTHFTFDHHNATDQSLIDSYVDDGQLAIAFKKNKGHYFILSDILDSGEYTVRDPLWYLTKTTDDVKDILNHVQGYDGSMDSANLFTFSKQEKPLPKWIEIHLGSPAELLITDSQNRRAGYDPETGEVILEIPGSSYGQAEGVVSADTVGEEVHLEKVLMIQSPTDDLFTLDVIGTGDGPYNLTVATNGGLNSTEIETIASSTSVGHVDSYMIDVPDQQGVSRAVERLRELAAEKELTQPDVSQNLYSIAERLENYNVVHASS